MLTPLKNLPEGLFWSAPQALDSDFTAEDPLALDYLGQQVGLWLFKGFTTRTNRAQNYAVVLYGLYLAEEAIQNYGYSSDDKKRVELFERWERFWALATLEYKNGEMDRGDEDTMRGVRGATKAWFSGDKALPLDFTLISRQNELGGLGAYLTSLREYGLVFSGSLRITPAAKEIVNNFWSEIGERDMSALYKDYALSALDLNRTTIARSHGRLTLSGLGGRSRLSSLTAHHRTKQQERLWNALFIAARDGSTLIMANCLIMAHVIEDPELLLEGILSGRWGKLSPDQVINVEISLAFGRLARVLLQRFNLAYAYIDEHGWVADFDDVAKACFAKKDLPAIRTACTSLLSSVGARKFGLLPYHGPTFISFLTKLSTADTNQSLEYLLTFHKAVQRSRRGGGTWLRQEQNKVVMQVAGYNGSQSEDRFPALKLNVVRQLLADLGRLK